MHTCGVHVEKLLWYLYIRLIFQLFKKKVKQKKEKEMRKQKKNNRDKKRRKEFSMPKYYCDIPPHCMQKLGEC